MGTDAVLSTTRVRCHHGCVIHETVTPAALRLPRRREDAGLALSRDVRSMNQGPDSGGVVRHSGSGSDLPSSGARTGTAAPLGRRLALLVTAVAVPLVALAAFLVWQSHEGMRQRAEEALLARATAIALAVDREFDRAWLLLEALAASKALDRGDLGAFEEEMRTASAVFGGVPVTFVSPDGFFLLSTTWPPGVRRSGIRAPDVALRVLSSGRGEVANLFRGSLNGGLAAAVGLPIFERDGSDDGREARLRGGVGLSLPRDRISALLRAQGVPETTGSVAAILDRDGVSVARTGPEEGVVGRVARMETLRYFVASEKGVVHGVDTLEGVPVVMAFVRGPRSGFIYLVTTPQAAFSAPLRESLAWMACGGALVLAAGVGIAALLARRTVAAFRSAASTTPVGMASSSGSTGLREADELASAVAGAAAERGRAEQALRAAERRNTEVLASIGEPLCSLDRDGQVEYASASALAFWGKASDEMLGRRFDDVFPEGVGSAAWEAKRLVAEQGVPLHLCTVSPLASRWIELDVYPRGDGGITVAFRDVHDRRAAELDRRRAEAAQRESEARFRLIAESAPIMLWMGDAAGHCIYLNAALRSFWGVADPSVLDEFGWTSTLHPDDAAGLFACVGPAMAGHSGFECEARYRRHDGSYRVLHTLARPRFGPGGEFLGVIGVNTDVTEAREAESALRRSEERLRLAQEAGGIGAWELDLVTGRRFWSSSNYRIWGLEPGTEVTPDLIFSLIHPEDVETARTAVARASTMVGTLPDLEIRVVRRSDRAVRWILSRAEAIAGVDGKPARHIGVMRDVTDQHEAVERLTLLMRELDHRAKNALAVVSGVVRLTPREDPDSFARAVEGRVRALARAHGLLAEGRWSGADLRTLVQGELAAFMVDSDVEGVSSGPRAEIHGPQVKLHAQAVQAITMALHELATNATKYGALSRESGVVRVTWIIDVAGGKLHLRWSEEGGPQVTGAPSRRGFGSRVLEATIRNQLNGRFECHWLLEGLACDISIPLGFAPSVDDIQGTGSWEAGAR